MQICLQYSYNIRICLNNDLQIERCVWNIMYRWVADFLNGEYITSQWFNSIAETFLHTILNKKFILLHCGRPKGEFYVFYMEDSKGETVTYSGKLFELCQLNSEY